MKQKLITFVVPCYNSQDYMDICLESLLTAGEQAEILIVNDGSTDRTGEIAADYAARYPSIVRVLTQPNGGHGEGINHGLREATGLYFKVVDSDDWLGTTELAAVLARLRSLELEGGVDLMVCNYVYDHRDPKLNRSITYGNVFPRGKVVGWDKTRPFLPWQYLTMHSCLHRTEILRKAGIVLPKHVFYEDNLFAYTPLPLVKRICYMDLDLYHYLIGRADQSVAEEMLKKRCSHQVLVSLSAFKAHHLEPIFKSEPKLAKYLYHELTFLMTIATVFTRLNRTKEAEQQIRDMWAEAEAFDPKLAKKIRKRSMCSFVNLPKAPGRDLGLGFYRLSHKLVPFN